MILMEGSGMVGWEGGGGRWCVNEKDVLRIFEDFAA